MCAKSDTKQNRFWTSNQDAKFRPETERARRYAQCGFVDMGALKRSMLRRVRCVFCNVAEMTSSGANAKSIGNIRNMWQNEIRDNCVNRSGSQYSLEFGTKSKMLLKPMVGAIFGKDALE